MDVLQKLGSSQETSECQNLLSILKGIHGGQGPNSIPRNSHTETWGHKRTGNTLESTRDVSECQKEEQREIPQREESVQIRKHLVFQAVQYKCYHY